MATQYTVQRARKDNTLYGPVHFSEDADTTLCGQTVDARWFILTTDGDGKATCKQCLKKAKEKNDG
jgi:hypothetical protein